MFEPIESIRISKESNTLPSFLNGFAKLPITFMNLFASKSTAPIVPATKIS